MIRTAFTVYSFTILVLILFAVICEQSLVEFKTLGAVTALVFAVLANAWRDE